jgi:hypothetical protein
VISLAAARSIENRRVALIVDHAALAADQVTLR